MPRTKLGEHVKAMSRKPISITEMICGRVTTQNVDMDKLAEAMGCKRTTAYTRMRQPIEQWNVGEMLGACKFLNIPPEELRAKIEY